MKNQSGNLQFILEIIKVPVASKFQPRLAGVLSLIRSYSNPQFFSNDGARLLSFLTSFLLNFELSAL